MALVEGLTPSWLWRGLLFLIGLVLYRATIRLLASDLHFIVSGSKPDSRSRVRLLLRKVS